MNKSWLTWIFVLGIIVTVLVAFNRQGTNQSVPLSEIFPEEEAQPVDVEYEFVDEKPMARTVESVPEKQTAAAAKKTAATGEAKAEKSAEAMQKPAGTASDDTSQKTIAASGLKTIPEYTIQVASFKERERAQNAIAELKKKGYDDGFIVSRDLAEKGTWHRVYVGQFNEKESAESFLSKIKNDFSGSFIISPKK